MKLSIVAATGGIGRCLVEQARSAGHEVTALVRDPARLPPGVRGVRVDLGSPSSSDAIASALAGSDAVLSGLGPRRKADAGIAAPGTRALIGGMAAAGVRRIVVVSAAPTSTVAVPGRPHPPRHDPGDGFVMRHVLSPMIGRILREHYHDLAVMEEDLRASGLEWTVVRPPRLNDKPLTGRYRREFGRNIRGGFSVPRADVAHLMLRLLDEPGSVGQFVGIAT